MLAGIPFFMTNDEWYRELTDEEIDENIERDDDDRGLVLTDAAPPEAVKSYEEFYAAYGKNGEVF